MRINPKHNNPDDPTPTPPASRGRSSELEMIESASPLTALELIEYHQRVIDEKRDRKRQREFLDQMDDLAIELHGRAISICKRFAFGSGLAA